MTTSNPILGCFGDGFVPGKLGSKSEGAALRAMSRDVGSIDIFVVERLFEDQPRDVSNAELVSFAALRAKSA